MTRSLATLALLLASTAAQAQLVVQPPPVVVQPPPVVVQPPPVVIDPPQPPPPTVCAAVSYGPPLNLRQWPNGAWLGTYWAGTRVLVDGGEGNWAHVIIGPAAGWMFAQYLVPVPCGF